MKHETLKKLAGVTAAAAMSLAPMMAMAETVPSALVKGGALNLRETASLSAKVLGQFPTGTLVEIIESGDEWHKVEVGGKSGYMMAKYLSTEKGSLSATVRTNTGIGLNLREEPDMKGAIINSFKPGTKVTVLQKSGEWSRVEVEGQEGFMATRYLAFSSGNASSSNGATGKIALVNNPKDTQVLNLRQQASLDAKVLAYYRNGAKVTVLSGGDTWYKVQTEDGKIGYMMAKFLKVTDEKAEAAPYTAKLFNINGGSYVNFRKGPSLSAGVIRKVPVGTEITVLEHGTDWCKVDVEGETGYISTWFMK